MFNLGNNLNKDTLDELLKDRDDDIVIRTNSLVGLAFKRDDDEGYGIFNEKY
jgi:hypothetical protein